MSVCFEPWYQVISRFIKCLFTCRVIATRARARAIIKQGVAGGTLGNVNFVDKFISPRAELWKALLVLLLLLLYRFASGFAAMRFAQNRRLPRVHSESRKVEFSKIHECSGIIFAQLGGGSSERLYSGAILLYKYKAATLSASTYPIVQWCK